MRLPLSKIGSLQRFGLRKVGRLGSVDRIAYSLAMATTRTDPRAGTEWFRPADAFWRRVERSDPDSCWEWTGARMASGYGRVWTGVHAGFSHRVAYELGIGESPGSLMVCHRCDNPPCCNPDHLFLGTRADNNRDARDKNIGRAKFGPDNHRARIPTATVDLIRTRVAAGERQKDVASSLGLNKSYVSRVVRGQRRVRA